MMTVSQLIKRLTRCPPDAVVFQYNPEWIEMYAHLEVEMLCGKAVLHCGSIDKGGARMKPNGSD